MSDTDKQAGQPRDPRGGYHSGPFPEQEQKQPGLTAPMEPKPDHGELSYEGHGKLQGKAALITGGDSGIGKAAAIAFAREGADVAISYLPEEEEDAQDTADWIRKAGQRVLLFAGDGREEEFSTRIAEETVSGFGRLDVVVLNAAYQKNRESLESLPTRSSTASSRPTSTRCSGPRGPPYRTSSRVLPSSPRRQSRPSTRRRA
jgi:hypothetical protein